MSEEILDVRKLLDKSAKAKEEQKNLAPVLEVDLGNLLAFDFQDQKKGFSIKNQS